MIKRLQQTLNRSSSIKSPNIRIIKFIIFWKINSIRHILAMIDNEKPLFQHTEPFDIESYIRNDLPFLPQLSIKKCNCVQVGFPKIPTTASCGIFSLKQSLIGICISDPGFGQYI